MTRLRLHGYWRSSATYRVRIALALKGLDYDYVPVDLARGGGEQLQAPYLALNPEARVPTLEAGGLKLTQSMAILEWLEETYAQPALLPPDAAGRARVRGLAQLVVADIQPLQNTSVTRYLRETARLDDAATAAWLRHWIGRGLQAFEAQLAASPATGRCCHGDAPTLADACLVPQCYAARRFGVDPAAFPRISAIERFCNGQPPFQAALPERQPDARA